LAPPVSNGSADRLRGPKTGWLKCRCIPHYIKNVRGKSGACDLRRGGLVKRAMELGHSTSPGTVVGDAERHHTGCVRIGFLFGMGSQRRVGCVSRGGGRHLMGALSGGWGAARRGDVGGPNAPPDCGNPRKRFVPMSCLSRRRLRKTDASTIIVKSKSTQPEIEKTSEQIHSANCPVYVSSPFGSRMGQPGFFLRPRGGPTRPTHPPIPPPRGGDRP